MGRQKHIHWSHQRTRRSVVQLQLWDHNPRLLGQAIGQSEKRIIELISSRWNLAALAASIVREGFYGFEVPVAVDVGGKLVVIEGNRRLATLKMIHNPRLAPTKAMQRAFERFGRQASGLELSRIEVTVAPTLSEAREYITRRHSGPPVAKWDTVAKDQWFVDTYLDEGENIASAAEICRVNESAIRVSLAHMKLWQFLQRLSGIGEEDRRLIGDAENFPITTLFRAVEFPSGEEFTGIKVSGDSVKVVVSARYVDAALSAIVRDMLHGDEKTRISSRTINSNDDLSVKLRQNSPPPSPGPFHIGVPKGTGLFDISLAGELIGTDSGGSGSADERVNGHGEQGHGATDGTAGVDVGNGSSDAPKESRRKSGQTGIIPANLVLGNEIPERIRCIWNDLQKIHVNTRTETVSVMLRVLLDLAVSSYIDENGLKDDLHRRCSGKRDDPRNLKTRLQFILDECKLDKEKAKVIRKLFEENNNVINLDTLNLFVHGLHAKPLITCDTVRSFWAALLPLFEELLDIQQLS